jgi:hypothetical protein
MSSKIPRKKKFANTIPSMLSLSTIGKKVKITPEHEQIIFNRIACITLNLTNLVKGSEPLEHTINTQTIKMKISKLFSV